MGLATVGAGALRVPSFRAAPQPVVIVVPSYVQKAVTDLKASNFKASLGIKTKLYENNPAKYGGSKLSDFNQYGQKN